MCVPRARRAFRPLHAAGFPSGCSGAEDLVVCYLLGRDDLIHRLGDPDRIKYMHGIQNEVAEMHGCAQIMEEVNQHFPTFLLADACLVQMPVYSSLLM